MSTPIAHDVFVKEIRALLDETFENVSGIYLDRQTSLFETVDSLDSDTVSTPLVPGGTTIAGHLAHIKFYLDVSLDYMQGKQLGKIDWTQSWVTRTVDEREWSELRESLHETTSRVREAIDSFTDFNSEPALAGALAVTVHTAFHLGAIRQILLVAQQ